MPEAHVNPLPAIAVINGNQLVPIADSPDNVLERDVVGNKTDTVAGNSVISLLKQIEGAGFATGTDSLKIISDVLDLVRTELTFQQQPDALLSQANPVSTTYYTVLDTTLNVRLISVNALVTWGVTQPTPLAVRITIDGNTIIMSKGNPVTATDYYGRTYANLAIANYPLDTNDSTDFRSFLLEGRSVKVEVAITWGVTQPTPLVCRVKWAKR